MAEHPITPPPELVSEWARNRSYSCSSELWDYIATQAARWGADHELEACCEWLGGMFNGHQTWADELRVDRRPKPPSLKEQALEALEHIDGHAIQQMSAYAIHDILKNDADTIRRALEALDD